MKYWFLLLILATVPLRLSGQDNTVEKKRLAKEYLLHQKFHEALITLTSSRELKTDDKEWQFLIAVCQFYLNQLNESERTLRELMRDERTPFPESWLFMGRIYHARHQFAEAASYYKDYLRTIGEAHPNRQMVVDEILRCSNGLQLQYRTPAAVVENLGSGVNTEYGEWGPIPSPTISDRLYFTSNRQGALGGPRNASGNIDERLGQYRSDIFYCRNAGGVWQETQPMHYLLNSPQNEVLLDFNPNGQVLYYYKGADMINGTVMVDTFREERSLYSDPFTGPINAYGEQAAPHFIDGATVIFPSRRPGGYGGLDLYLTRRIDGRWTEPENLGPVVNSAYDETTPFLSRDGKTLYFSSNDRNKSIGGYDIFRSFYVARAGRWSAPQNLGLPINSSADDTHYRPGNDGFSAFFSSSRKDGLGGSDIYVAYFNDFLSEQEPPASLDQTFLATKSDLPVSPSPVSTETGEATTSSSVAIPPAPATSLLPLRCDSKRAIFSGENLQSIEQLASLLKEYPAAKVVMRILAGVSGKETLGQLFDAMEYGQAVINYLKAREVPTASLALLAQPLPETVAASPYVMDFVIDAPEPLPEGFKSGTLKEVPVADREYRIRIATLGGKFSGSILDGWPEPMVLKDPSRNIYHYYVGKAGNMEEAESILNTLKESGFSATKVVSFKNAWPEN